MNINFVKDIPNINFSNRTVETMKENYNELQFKDKPFRMSFIVQTTIIRCFANRGKLKAKAPSNIVTLDRNC